MSVASRVIHIIRRLVRQGSRPLMELFDDAGDRSEAVATFLAVLELIKSRRLRVEDSPAGEPAGGVVRMVKR